MNRLDKLLSISGAATRKEAALLAKNGRITVNGVVVTDNSRKFDNTAVICIDNKPVNTSAHRHIMLNKPQGVVCATTDNLHKTVLDLLDNSLPVKRMFPSGRLDIDTVGFVFITTDGELAHRIISPKSHVDKKYLVKVDSPLTPDDITAFEKGIALSDDITTLPAKLKILDNPCNAEVIIREGKYHQIKRMFLSLSKKVVFLKRIKIGGVDLDPSLPLGGYRELTPEELVLIEKRSDL